MPKTRAQSDKRRECFLMRPQRTLTCNFIKIRGWNYPNFPCQGCMGSLIMNFGEYKMANTIWQTKIQKVTWLRWNLVLGGFWNRWLRIWAQHSEIQNFEIKTLGGNISQNFSEIISDFLLFQFSVKFWEIFQIYSGWQESHVYYFPRRHYARVRLLERYSGKICTCVLEI